MNPKFLAKAASTAGAITLKNHCPIGTGTVLAYKRHELVKNFLNPKARCAAVTLLEALFSLIIIGLVTGGLYTGLNQLNQMAATANRLNACAVEIVSDQINRALQATPFVFGGSPPLAFPQLTGSATSTSSNQPIYIDPAASTPVLLLAGSSSGIGAVSGTLAITVAPQWVAFSTGTGATLTTGSIQIQQVTVNLGYLYRNKNYNVQMSTVRSYDPP